MGDVMLEGICIEINFCASKSDGRCVFGGDLYRNKFLHLSDGWCVVGGNLCRNKLMQLKQ